VIASLRGPVHHVGLDHVVVEVGGMGMRVHTTPATASSCRRGSETLLSTSLVVREDALTLYGFSAADERDMFETLQSVSGVGPRLALAMLSVLGPDDIRRAISAADVLALTKVPGIGRKGAERMVLELRDRIGAGVPVRAGASAAPGVAPWREQVTDALVGLGWSARQAAEAVDRVASQAGDDPQVAELLRAALRELGR
jgi:Holliday junction DNA helicase RuvA